MWQFVQDIVLFCIQDGIWFEGELIFIECDLVVELGCVCVIVNCVMQVLVEIGVIECCCKVGMWVVDYLCVQFVCLFLWCELEVVGYVYGYCYLLFVEVMLLVDVVCNMLVCNLEMLLFNCGVFLLDGVFYCCEECWINIYVVFGLNVEMLVKISVCEWFLGYVLLNCVIILIGVCSVEVEFIGVVLGIVVDEFVLQFEWLEWLNNMLVLLLCCYFLLSYCFEGEMQVFLS